VAWCGDITYIPTDEGWLYLASVLDLGSRRLLGWAMEEQMPTALVAGALDMAVDSAWQRGSPVSSSTPTAGASICRRSSVSSATATASASRPDGWPRASTTAVAESFWSSLKRELVHRYRFATRADAKAAITAWIKRYNVVRLHSTLGYVPPVEWELHYRLTQQQAA
jgi:putative transposase